MGKVAEVNAVSLTGTELTKKQIYFATQGKENVPVNELEDGHVIKPIGYVEFVDINNNGDEREVFSVIAEDGTVYSTISKTFKESFKTIVELMQPDKFEVKKLSGKTKAGRDYIDCELV